MSGAISYPLRPHCTSFCTIEPDLETADAYILLGGQQLPPYDMAYLRKHKYDVIHNRYLLKLYVRMMDSEVESKISSIRNSKKHNSRTLRIAYSILTTQRSRATSKTQGVFST